jgi:hypothetical protein
LRAIFTIREGQPVVAARKLSVFFCIELSGTRTFRFSLGNITPALLLRFDKREVSMTPPQNAVYFFGGLIMMCAPAVPGYINHGALSLALVDSPVVSVVAKGT